MAGEMQACLPSSRSPLLQQPPSTQGGKDKKDDSPPAFASRDSGLDEVQRQHLRVAAAAFMLKRHLFRYQGTVSAALVLGGVDAAGEHLYQVNTCTKYIAADVLSVFSVLPAFGRCSITR